MSVSNKGRLIRKIRDNLFYFILSKGVAFLSPILFLRFVSLEEYGVVEFSYSLGSVAAVIGMLGLGGAYPYFILKKGDQSKEQVFMLYGLPILAIAIVTCLLRCAGLLSQQISLLILFILIFALQRLYSSILKSNNKGYLGVLFDSGYYFLLAGVIFACWMFGALRPLELLEIGMQVYLLILATFFVWRFYMIRSKSIQVILRDDCREVLQYSLHLIVSGLLIYWLTSSARIYIGYFMDYEQVGIYSFYFRLAGIAIVIYQFLYIAFFKRLYMAANKQLDLYYSIILGLVLLGCLICYLCVPLLSRFLLQDVELGNARIFLLLALQMPVWVGISLCEGIVGRENLVSRMNINIGICVLLFPVVLFLFRNQLTLELFILLNSISFSIAFMTQISILRRKQILLKRCLIFNIFLCAASIIAYFTDLL